MDSDFEQRPTEDYAMHYFTITRNLTVRFSLFPKENEIKKKRKKKQKFFPTFSTPLPPRMQFLCAFIFNFNSTELQVKGYL